MKCVMCHTWTKLPDADLESVRCLQASVGATWIITGRLILKCDSSRLDLSPRHSPGWLSAWAGSSWGF